MLLLLLAYLGGLLTIVSPCILPVLPFVFSRANGPFMRSGLPLLAGMVLTFALTGSLATLGGSWTADAGQYGRWLGLALAAVFSLTLLWPGLSTTLTRPLVAAGERLSGSAGRVESHGVVASMVLGAATGLLWAPCAGPILGLILTGAAFQSDRASSVGLLLAYAAGAATSMAAALVIGGRVLAAMRRAIGVGERLKQAMGCVMLTGVVVIAGGWDAALLSGLSWAPTTQVERGLVDRLASPAELPPEGAAPSFTGATAWLNGSPVSIDRLRGKVVLVDFWTYGCVNCLRTLPHVKAWADRYGPEGLVVVGVHAPEFAHERDLANVQKAVKDLGIGYLVAVDNDFKIWRAYGNQYWPAHYFVDAQGRIRHHQFGEGNEERSEQVIRQLLQELHAAR